MPTQLRSCTPDRTNSSRVRLEEFHPQQQQRTSLLTQTLILILQHHDHDQLERPRSPTVFMPHHTRGKTSSNSYTNANAMDTVFRPHECPDSSDHATLPSPVNPQPVSVTSRFHPNGGTDVVDGIIASNHAKTMTMSTHSSSHRNTSSTSTSTHSRNSISRHSVSNSNRNGRNVSVSNHNSNSNHSQRVKNILQTKVAANGSSLKPPQRGASSDDLAAMVAPLTASSHSNSNGNNGNSNNNNNTTNSNGDDTNKQSRKRSRYVRFSQWESIHPIINIDEFTKQEFDAVWYTRHEYDVIFDHCEITAEVLEEYGFVRGKDLCACGLEHWTIAGTKKRERNRAIAFDTVMNEQDEQWRQGSDNHERLGNMYAKVTANSGMVAMTLGLRLEREVQMFTTPAERDALRQAGKNKRSGRAVDPVSKKKKKRNKSKERKTSSSDAVATNNNGKDKASKKIKKKKSSGGRSSSPSARKSGKKKKKSSSTKRRAKSERNLLSRANKSAHSTIGTGESSDHTRGTQDSMVKHNKSKHSAKADKTAVYNALLSSPVVAEPRRPLSMGNLTSFGVGKKLASTAEADDDDSSGHSFYDDDEDKTPLTDFALSLDSELLKPAESTYEVDARPGDGKATTITMDTAASSKRRGSTSHHSVSHNSCESDESYEIDIIQDHVILPSGQIRQSITLKDIKAYAGRADGGQPIESSSSSSDEPANATIGTSATQLSSFEDLDENGDYHDHDSEDEYNVPLHSVTDESDVSASSEFGILSETESVDTHRSDSDTSIGASLTDHFQKMNKQKSMSSGNSVASATGRSAHSRSSIGGPRRVPGRPATLISPSGVLIKKRRPKKNEFSPSQALINALAATAKPSPTAGRPPVAVNTLPPAPPLIPGGSSRKSGKPPQSDKPRVRIIDPPAHSLCASPASQTQQSSRTLSSGSMAGSDIMDNATGSSNESFSTLRTTASNNTLMNSQVMNTSVPTVNAKQRRDTSHLAKDGKLSHDSDDVLQDTTERARGGSELATKKPKSLRRSKSTSSKDVRKKSSRSNRNVMDEDATPRKANLRSQSFHSFTSSSQASQQQPMESHPLDTSTSSTTGDDLAELTQSTAQASETLAALEKMNAMYILSSSGTLNVKSFSCDSSESSSSSLHEMERMIAKLKETRTLADQQQGKHSNDAASHDSSDDDDDNAGPKYPSSQRALLDHLSTSVEMMRGATKQGEADPIKKPQSMMSLGSTGSKHKKTRKASSQRNLKPKKKSSSGEPREKLKRRKSSSKKDAKGSGDDGIKKKPKSSRSLRKIMDVTATSFMSLPDVSASRDGISDDVKKSKKKKKESSKKKERKSLKKSKSFSGDMTKLPSASDVKGLKRRKPLRPTKSFEVPLSTSIRSVESTASRSAMSTSSDASIATLSSTSSSVSLQGSEDCPTISEASADITESDIGSIETETARGSGGSCRKVSRFSGLSSRSLGQSATATPTSKQPGNGNTATSSTSKGRTQVDKSISNNSITSHTTDTTYSSGGVNEDDSLESDAGMAKAVSSKHADKAAATTKKKKKKKQETKKPNSTRKIKFQKTGKPLSFLSVCNE